MHSNRYTFLYAVAIATITAVILAFASEGLRPRQEANIELDKKTSLLRAVRVSTTERDSIEAIYRERMQEVVVNSEGEIQEGITSDHIVLKDELDKPGSERFLPLFIYTPSGGDKKYIVPMQGTGLWGPIWGYISFEDDLNTVYGAYFAHKAETPGLGAEISETPFQNQFIGKKILSENNNFVSVRVVKKASKAPFGPEHRVDGISGGTITSAGTDAMLRNAIEPYLVYFQKLRQQG